MEKKKIASNIKPVSNTIRSTIHTSDTNQEMLLDEFDVKIIKKATQKAVMGNANLQYHLGVIYYNGWSVKQDYNEALKWYELAAKHNHTWALHNLAIMYERGIGVKQNYDLAVKYYTSAAKLGLSGAQTNLGFLYEKGLGVNQSIDDAITWYKKGAKNKDTKAMCNLGNLYYYGRGVKCNYLTALDWYKQAAVLNDAKAQCYLGDMYILGDKPGIKRDVVAGFYWYEQSAKNGYPIGQYNLAIIYEIGNEYIKQDYDLAIKWYKEAISSGYMKAKNALGVCILALTLQTEENFSLAKYN